MVPRRFCFLLVLQYNHKTSAIHIQAEYMATHGTVGNLLPFYSLLLPCAQAKQERLALLVETRRRFSFLSRLLGSVGALRADWHAAGVTTFWIEQEQLPLSRIGQDG